MAPEPQSPEPLVCLHGRFFFERAVIDRALGTVELTEGVSLPFGLGRRVWRRRSFTLAGLEHLRLFAYLDGDGPDGPVGPVRYAIAIEGAVDRRRLHQLHMPQNGFVLASRPTLEEARALAERAASYLGFELLVPERLAGSAPGPR